MIRPFQGMHPAVDPSVFVAETAVIVGDVTIGAGSSIWYNVVIRGDVNCIRIGERTNIQDLSMLHVTHRHEDGDPGAPLVIGHNVTVGHGVTLHGCTIGNGVLIGMQAIVMDGATVGDGALVGARSLVTAGTVIPPRTLWMGAPATYRRDLTPAEQEKLRASADNYVAYARQYRQEDPKPDGV